MSLSLFQQLHEITVRKLLIKFVVLHLKKMVYQHTIFFKKKLALLSTQATS